MGFGGSTAAMITSIKNNNRRSKKEGFDNFSNSHLEKGRIPRKPISKEALAKIRRKLKTEQYSLLVKRIVVFCLVTLLLTLGIYFLLN